MTRKGNQQSGSIHYTTLLLLLVILYKPNTTDTDTIDSKEEHAHHYITDTVDSKVIIVRHVANDKNYYPPCNKKTQDLHVYNTFLYVQCPDKIYLSVAID